MLLSDSVFMAQITLKHWILTKKIMLILSRFLARSHSCLTGCHRDYTKRPLPALTDFDDQYNLVDRITMFCTFAVNFYSERESGSFSHFNRFGFCR